MKAEPTSHEAKDPERFLATDDLQEGLRIRSVSGAFVTLTAQALNFLLRIGSLYVLARILTPSDFGLIAMVTAVTGLVVLFKDLGLSMATVQRAVITHAQVSTLFWVNTGLSALIMLLTALAAPVIAWFYGEPQLTWITLVLAAGILLGGLTVQHQALLRRQMRFRALAAIEILAQATGVAVAISAASLGAGYWALVLQQLALALCNFIAVWIACGWRPGSPVRGSGVRPLLRYGGNLTGFSIFNYFARNLDDVLIGRYWGAGDLGLYTRAYALLMLPLTQINAPISGIAVPALSRLQDQPERYGRYYLKTVGIIALICMPLVALLAVLSNEIVLVVLGEQWIGAGELFSILAVAAFVHPVISTGSWVYMSLGQTHRMARWGMLLASLRCLCFVIGLPWGPRGVALGYTIGVYLVAFPALRAAYRYSPIGLGALIRAVGRPAVLGLVVGLSAYLARQWFRSAAPLTIIAAAAAAALVATTLMLRVWPALRTEVKNFLLLIRELRRSKAEGTP